MVGEAAIGVVALVAVFTPTMCLKYAPRPPWQFVPSLPRNVSEICGAPAVAVCSLFAPQCV
eukprot:10160221-Prorocentrum_lima.AAC.1